MIGRYTHNAFWQEPQLIDTDDPMLGMAQHYLLCPPTTPEDHARADAQRLPQLRDRRRRLPRHPDLPRVRQRAERHVEHGPAAKLGIPTMFFEGDIADAAFYKDEVLESRLEAMLEAIDVNRMRAA